MWGWWGFWPGRGPFSYLPPWLRPGWLLGPGSGWWLLFTGQYPWFPAGYNPAVGLQYLTQLGIITPEQELTMLENYKKTLEETLKNIEKRINELKGKASQ
ncbi:MAG: DUF5320 domain-containing protein [Candidatus Njordarchaeia archaeon]|nr:DUF5320 domain-containing protein [Candidatus Korarchaeota archaeon]